MGILFAIGALIFWGIGDFFIQRSAKKFGDWESLFIISVIGLIIMTPFAYRELEILHELFRNNYFILIASALLFLGTSLIYFEALKRGKLSVIEPVGAMELPIVGILALFIAEEFLSNYNIILMTSLLAGIVLISLKTHHFSKNIWLEKGVFLAILAAILAGLTDFLISYSARITNPLLTIWFLNIFVTLCSFIYLSTTKKLNRLYLDFRLNKKDMIVVSLLDNLAWISFGSAVVLMPMATTLAISEGYIALSSLLGLMINKEKLMLHQKGGLALAIISAILLVIYI